MTGSECALTVLSFIVADSSIHVKLHLKQPRIIEAAGFRLVGMACAVGLLSLFVAFAAEHIQALSWLNPVAGKLLTVALICALLTFVGSPFCAFPWLVRRIISCVEFFLPLPPAGSLTDYKPSNDTPPPRHHLH